jgi:hypothetical protein
MPWAGTLGAAHGRLCPQRPQAKDHRSPAHASQRRRTTLILPVSAVALFGVLVVLLIRYAGLRIWHALIAALFGFFVASTTAAPQIRAALDSVINVLSGH